MKLKTYHSDIMRKQSEKNYELLNEKQQNPDYQRLSESEPIWKREIMKVKRSIIETKLG